MDHSKLTFWHFIKTVRLNFLRNKAKSSNLSGYQLKIKAVVMQPHRPVLTGTVRI